MTDTAHPYDDSYARDLGDGLVLRWSRPDDVEQIASLYAQVFRPKADAPLNWHVPHWTRAAFNGRRPNIGPNDFAVVEATTTRTIVAVSCLLRYTFAFEGVVVPFGRPEMVATLPEYRNRGLIRAIFGLIHAKSEARGDLVQGITGIENYYRQFGYEYAVPLGTGLTVYFPAIPALKADEAEPYTVHKATAEDIPLVRRLWDREQMGAALTTPLSAEYCRWAMEDISETVERWDLYLIVDGSGRSVGYLRLQSARWGPELHVENIMVVEGVRFAAVVPSVLRGVRALADTVRAMRPDTPPAGAVKFHLWSTAHPLLGVLGNLLPVTMAHPFGPYPELWYIRVPNLPRFLRQIAPVLERRLVGTAQAGYTGELTLDFYRGGLRLAFEDGKLTAAENWKLPLWGERKAGIPALVFLQLLFGYRTLHELRGLFSDVWAEGDATPVLDALFPKLQTSLVALD